MYAHGELNLAFEREREKRERGEREREREKRERGEREREIST